MGRQNINQMNDNKTLPLTTMLSQAAHEEFPDKFILYTEACAGERPLDPAVALGSWGRGERYLNNIVEDNMCLCSEQNDNGVDFSVWTLGQGWMD